MKPLEPGLAAGVALMDQTRTLYMLTGSLAAAVWGYPRATFGVDLMVWAPGDAEKTLIQALCAACKPRVDEPNAFVEATRVLPLEAEGTRLDVIFGRQPYEERAVTRAKTLSVAGRFVRVATVEDLVFHKLLSDRPKDKADAQALVQLMKGGVDRAYLDPLVRDASLMLARPALLSDYLASFPA